LKARIAVLGANGVYARHLIPKLVGAECPVTAIVRRSEAASFARACGADVQVADIFDTESMVVALEGCAIAINLATSLPGPSGRGDFAANDLLRLTGVPNFVEACGRAGVRRIIQQSIAFVNASGTADWTDEEAIYQSSEDTIATRAIAAALGMEETIRASSLDWIILRGGLFYGPGTGFDDDWYVRAAAGKLRIPGDGTDFVSLVHISDMAAATVAAIRVWPAKSTLIVCDDEPAQWRDVFGFIFENQGKGVPEDGGRVGFPSFRLQNVRARSVLGWQPFYRSYKEGLAR
jgi:nucleoside-diphosphate-sugar epimerase